MNHTKNPEINESAGPFVHYRNEPDLDKMDIVELTTEKRRHAHYGNPGHTGRRRHLAAYSANPSRNKMRQNKKVFINSKKLHITRKESKPELAKNSTSLFFSDCPITQAESIAELFKNKTAKIGATL